MARPEPLERELWVSRGGAADVGRGVLGTALIGLAIVVGLAVGFGVGFAFQWPRAGGLAGIVAMATMLRLETVLARRLRAESEQRRVRIDAQSVRAEGLVTIARPDVRSIRYDPIYDVLWLHGVLGWPLLAIEAPIATVLRISDVLGVPDRGVRTFAASSPPAAVPWIGWIFLLIGGCLSLFAVTMLLGGPLWIALPATLVALPFAASFVPSRIHVSDSEITRRWLGIVQRVSTIEIQRVAVEHHFLVMETRRGTRRWRLRYDANTGHGAIAEWMYERWRAKAEGNDRVLTAVIGTRTGEAVARVFE
jgi:hypothetical protein